MRRTKFVLFAKAEGFCCPAQCLEMYARWKTADLAQAADMDIRSIRLLRQRKRQGAVACLKRFNCQRTSLEFLE